MPKPIYVRPLTDAERRALEAGLRAKDAFALRRCQILLASAKGQPASQIATALGCCTQTVRNALRDFAAKGLDCLVADSSRPKTVKPLLDADQRDRFLGILHQSPRAFDKPRSFWTLDLLGEVCLAQGLLPRRVTPESMRDALHRMGIDWKRAKRWITSPDPAYARKKGRETD